MTDVLLNHKIKLRNVRKSPQNLKAAQENGARFWFHILFKNGKIEILANKKIDAALEGPQFLWSNHAH